MTEQERTDIALKRYNMFAPYVINPEAYPGKKRFFKMRVEELRLKDGVSIHQRTLEGYYYDYLKHGFDGLKPKLREDQGKSRKNSDLVEQIITLKKNYPHLGATGIYKMILESGAKKEDISLSTVNRIVNSLPKVIENNKPMYRYELEHINEVWCGDSSHGAYLYKDKAKIKLYIIAFIDDASRLITAARIFEADNTINLLTTMKYGISKYGKPRLFNFDNGSNYKSGQINLAAAKLGVGIKYCRPYNPEAKAKIERWFRTLKSQWLASLRYSEFKNIEEYQLSLNEYVNKYNNTVHSSLDGLTPMERYLKEVNLVKRVDKEKLDNVFLFEVERKVSIDNIVQIENKEYEVPAIYSNQRVKIKYLNIDDGVYIYDKDRLVKINPLDKHENAKRVRIILDGDNHG